MATPSLSRGQGSDCLGLRLWEYRRTIYNGDAEKVRTHPLLLPRPKEAGVVFSEDLQVLVLYEALGVQGKDHDRQKESTPPVTPVQSM